MHRHPFLNICLVLLVTWINSHAQDPFFSQFYANRLSLNPAWAGIGEDRRLLVNYRNQYPGIGKIYQTYSISYDQYVDALQGGLGFAVTNDNQGSGAINQVSFSGIYAYHFKAGRFLSFSGGLQASVISNSIRSSDFEFGDMYDPVTGNVNTGSGSESYGNSTKVFPDFSAGIAGFFKDSYAGISLYHLLRPVQMDNSSQDARLPGRFTFFAGTYIPVYEKRLGKEVLKLNPNLIIMKQKDLSQIIYGMESLYKSKYTGGLWLRQNIGLKYSSLIFSGGVIFDKIRLRYSYDAQLSLPSIHIPRMGAHELSLIIIFDKSKKIKHKAIKCPKI